MASNVDAMEPMTTCSRFSKQAKGYVAVPQPNTNARYNKSMGGVDLMDNAEKNYAIVTRCKKWLWSIYAWSLNVLMLQAWRLYKGPQEGAARAGPEEGGGGSREVAEENGGDGLQQDGDHRQEEGQGEGEQAQKDCREEGELDPLAGVHTAGGGGDDEQARNQGRRPSLPGRRRQPCWALWLGLSLLEKS